MKDQLTRWIQRQVTRALEETERPIERVRVFRISAKRIYQLIQNIVAGLGQAEHHDPDVIIGKEICPLVVEPTVEGAAARAKFDVLELHKDLVPGSKSRARIGYAVRVGNTIFVLLGGSAHARDVDADVPEDERNSLIQVQRQLVRELSRLGEAHEPGFRLEMHFTEESRMARSAEHASDLLRTLKEHRVKLFTRGTQWDTTNSQHSMILGMLLGQAAGDRDASVYRLVKGKLAALIAGRLPEHVAWHVPFTHGPHRETRTDLETKKQFEKIDETRVALLLDQVPVLTQLVRRVLAEEEKMRTRGLKVFPWDDIAVWASETFGLTSRKRRDPDSPSVLVSQLNEPGLALKRHLSERMIDAWQTGFLEWTTWTDCEIPGLTEQLEELDRDQNGRVLVRGWVPCPRPDAGWGITDEEWDRLRILVRPSGDRVGRPPSGWGLPLASETWFSYDEAVQYRVTTNTGRYDLGWRPASEAYGSTGRPLGWRNRESNVTVVGALNANDLHASVGHELETLLEELSGTEQLGTLRVAPDTGQRISQTRDARKQLTAIEEEIADLHILIKGAKKFLHRYAAANDEDGQSDAEDSINTYRATLTELEAEAERLQAQLDTPIEPEAEEAVVDVSRLELVAAGLQTVWNDPNVTLDNPGALPPELAAACRALFRDSLRARVSGRFGTHIDWNVTCHIPLANGRIAVRTLDGRIKNSRIEASVHGDPQRVARLYLAEDWTYQQIGDEFHVDGSGEKNTLLLQTLKRYLRTPRDGERVIPTAAARRAILDGPLELRQAIWAWKENEPEVVSHLDPAWVDHVVSTYSDPEYAWGESWTASTWKVERDVIGLIGGLPDPRTGARLDWLLEQVPIHQHAMTRLSYAPETGRFTSRPGRDHPPVVWRNWARTDTPVEGKRLFLYECPHKDCPGRDDQTGPLVDHVLFVPENPVGLLCRHCHRAPDPEYAHIRFPDTYFEPWRKTDKEIDGTRSRSTTRALASPGETDGGGVEQQAA